MRSAVGVLEPEHVHGAVQVRRGHGVSRGVAAHGRHVAGGLIDRRGLVRLHLPDLHLRAGGQEGKVNIFLFMYLERNSK